LYNVFAFTVLTDVAAVMPDVREDSEDALTTALKELQTLQRRHAELEQKHTIVVEGHVELEKRCTAYEVCIRAIDVALARRDKDTVNERKKLSQTELQAVVGHAQIATARSRALSAQLRQARKHGSTLQRRLSRMRCVFVSLIKGLLFPQQR